MTTMFRDDYILAQATPEDSSTTEAPAQDGAEGTSGTTTPANPAAPGGQQTPARPPFEMYGIFVALMVFWLVLLLGRGKKQKKYDEMLKSLRKNDRVVTIGGIVGTVVSAKDDEVVIKVDESNNTKMTFVRRAIQSVLSDDQQT